MYEKTPYIPTNQNMKEEDPIEKLNISLNQLLFSLNNKEAFSSNDLEGSLNSKNKEEDFEKNEDNEGEELLNQFENLNNIYKNNNNISNENINEKKDNKINKKIFENNMRNKSILLEKLKEIKNENLEFKDEIKKYQIIFNEMIKIVLNGVMMKETEINKKYKNNINKLKKELELNVKKMNKLDIDYKKTTNSNLKKFNNR